MLRALIVTVLLCSAALPGAAQDIVVTGEREQARKAAVRALTNAVSQRSDGQVARFADPVCPDAAGFEPRYRQIVIDRLTTVARDAGLRIDTAGCRPNVTLMAVDNGQRELRDLYKRKPGLFAMLTPDARRRLLSDAGPVHVVNLTEIRDRDGERVKMTSPGGMGGDAAPILEVHSVSVIDPSTRQDISGSLVLIDRAAAMGKTLRQLADYAAMRLFARTREAEPGDNTILSLFARDNDPPREITGFDAAYLAALYRGPATRSYVAKMGEMSGNIIRKGARATTTDPAPQ